MKILRTTTTAELEINGEPIEVTFNEKGITKIKKDKFLIAYEELVKRDVIPMPKFINLTNHDIMLVKDDGELEIFEPSGIMARTNSVYENVNFGPIKIKRIASQVVEGLPAEQEGVFYIVSNSCLENSTRRDLVCPDLSRGSAVKDDNGELIGVRQFYMR